MYKQLTEVERAFRSMKDVLALRPIHHQSAPRVRAHIFVAALALLLQRFLERQLKDAGVDLSVTQALQAVGTMNHVTFKVAGRRRTGVSRVSSRARQVLKALGITKVKPPAAPQGGETVM